MIGIYKIINPNGKIYVGKSKNIEVRFNSYKKLQHCSQQTKLYNSLKKYGPENHIFEIIEECLYEELNDREIYWIKELQCMEFGLNLTFGGDGGKLNKESMESKRLNTMKPILQYSLDGTFIKEHKGASEAILTLEKGNANNINDCARGKYKSTYGFMWVYKNEIINKKIEPYKKSKPGFLNWSKEQRNKFNKTIKNKQINKWDYIPNKFKNTSCIL